MCGLAIHRFNLSAIFPRFARGPRRPHPLAPQGGRRRVRTGAPPGGRSPRRSRRPPNPSSPKGRRRRGGNPPRGAYGGCERRKGPPGGGGAPKAPLGSTSAQLPGGGVEERLRRSPPHPSPLAPVGVDERRLRRQSVTTPQLIHRKYWN